VTPATSVIEVVGPAIDWWQLVYVWVGVALIFGALIGRGIRLSDGHAPEPDDTQEFPPYSDEEEPAALPVDGGYLYRGRFYSSELVQQTLLSICDWWTQLTPSEQTALLGLAELAEMDREIDAAVFGATS
jgi:hypothetical protein